MFLFLKVLNINNFSIFIVLINLILTNYEIFNFLISIININYLTLLKDYLAKETSKNDNKIFIFSSLYIDQKTVFNC